MGRDMNKTYSNGALLSNVVWLNQTVVSHLSFIG